MRGFWKSTPPPIMSSFRTPAYLFCSVTPSPPVGAGFATVLTIITATLSSASRFSAADVITEHVWRQLWSVHGQCMATPSSIVPSISVTTLHSQTQSRNWITCHSEHRLNQKTDQCRQGLAKVIEFLRFR